MNKADKRKTPIYTIGHSTRPLQELVALLRENAIERLIDIRAYPGSRTNPQYNKDSLEKTIPDAGITYEHMRDLGGRRKASEKRDPSPNSFWNNTSFRNYADFAYSAAFQTALADLKRQSQEQACAIMCSEAVWWRCHRRIVADYLLADGYDVVHIMGPGKTPPAKITDGARIADKCRIIYDREAKK